MKKKIKFNFSILFYLILISFLARLTAVLLYGDTAIDHEWGILLNNLYNHKTYSFYEFENKLIPSSYMPPLYAFILLFLKVVSFNKINILSLIFAFQILLSLISIYIFYKINIQFFSVKTSRINTFMPYFLVLVWTAFYNIGCSLNMVAFVPFYSFLCFAMTYSAVKPLTIKTFEHSHSCTDT